MTEEIVTAIRLDEVEEFCKQTLGINTSNARWRTTATQVLETCKETVKEKISEYEYPILFSEPKINGENIVIPLADAHISDFINDRSGDTKLPLEITTYLDQARNAMIERGDEEVCVTGERKESLRVFLAEKAREIGIQVLQEQKTYIKQNAEFLSDTIEL